MKKWFSVVLGFEAQIAGAVVDRDGLREASVRLVEASDEVTAHTKAQQLGREAEHEYRNECGENVVWKFLGVGAVQEVGDPIHDGVEVFNRLHRAGTPADLADDWLLTAAEDLADRQT